MDIAQDAARSLWRDLGLPESFLKNLQFTGNPDRAVPSSFRLGAAAQVSMGCSSLAAAYFQELVGGRGQTVNVDARHAVIECASERYYQLDGQSAPSLWDPLAGAYQTFDGWVRIHTNFPHHRKGILELLGCDSSATREDVATAIRNWRTEHFEAAASAKGMCVAALRTFEQWDESEQALANKDVPPVELVRIQSSSYQRQEAAQASFPLTGLRVLELTRVLAGPTCGRMLAGLGADVLWITSPKLPALPGLDVDTSRGKRTTQLDLNSDKDSAILLQLVGESDVFLQSYRSDSLPQRGFGPTELAALNPGIIYAHLNAYGWNGPWWNRRGFDSLVQTAIGFNVAEAEAFAQLNQQNGHDPRPLPFQALDHVAGYMLALGICAALCRRHNEGGAWEVRVSLAGVGKWIRGLGFTETEDLIAAAPLPQPESLELVPLLQDWLGLETDQRTKGKIVRALRPTAQFSALDSVVPRVAPILLDVHTPSWL